VVHELVWELAAAEGKLKEVEDFALHELVIGNRGCIKHIVYLFAYHIADIRPDCHRHLLVFIMESFYCVSVVALSPDCLNQELAQGVHYPNVHSRVKLLY
jgi:hypothetical protein